VKKFNGFGAKTRFISLPAETFSELLPLIDDLGELKVTLFALWALLQKESDSDGYRYLRLSDFSDKEAVKMHNLKGPELDIALYRAIERGTLLKIEIAQNDETLYFANTANGRLAVEQIKAGRWQMSDTNDPVQILPERPNIYRIYEENIGALTPLIADDLKDAEREFGVEWVAEAIALSVSMEKRNLKYVRAILKRWKQEGKHETHQGTTRQADGGTDERRSIFGKYADYFEQ
jgi:DNA replication protein